MHGLMAQQSTKRRRVNSVKPLLHNIVQGFVDLVYPPSCPACKKALPRIAMETMVCLPCWEKIILNQPPFCHGCGRQMNKMDLGKTMCSHCIKTPHAYDRAYSVCAYDGTVKVLIHEFKYKDKQYLGRPLARLLIDFIKNTTCL